MRIYYYKPYKKLDSIFLIKFRLFYIIIIDFIINILFTRNPYTKKIYNNILVIIDKLIKFAIDILYIKNFNTESLITLI